MSASTETQIIGHAGSGSHGPPSSAAAIGESLDRGAAAILLDVQFAADSTPIDFHDRTLARAAGVNGTIRNQDIRELGGYDVGFRFGDRFRGTRLLTVEEAAGLIPDRVDIHLDIKDFDPVNAKHLRGLLGTLKRKGGLERCLLTSTSESVLATLGSTDRSVRRGLRTDSARSESVGRAASLGCGSLHPEASSTRRALVDACRESSIRIIPHSADDERAMRSMLDLGVDGITTGHPERLAEISRGMRSGRRQETRSAGRPGEETPPAGEAAAPATGRRRRERPPAEPADAAGDTPPPEAASRDDRTEAPERREASEAQDTAGERPAAAKRRRRGRRGGKREQARRARRSESAPPREDAPPGGAEIIPLEPVGEEAGTLELLGEIHAELDRESTGKEAGREAGDGRKRRRRGRRGGKRAQARRQRQKPSGSGSDS